MSVFFISDLHLQAERPDITRAFVHFIETTAKHAEQLYILGDLFEAWIGDDMPVPEFEQAFASLKNLSNSGCQIYFQCGNRDFLVGQKLMARIGATRLSDTAIVSLPVGPALLMHGDQLCTDDTEYQSFREMVRNPAWQQAFADKPINERIAIAKQLRSASKARGMEKADDIMDVNEQAVETAFKHADVDLMIHGHTHRPDIHTTKLDGRTRSRIVLGDWDHSLWYLSCDINGLNLVDEPILGL